MATQDITFTSEIKVNTEQAKKDVQQLAKDIEGVFRKTGQMMSESLRSKSGSFGFSALTNNYATGIDALSRIYNKHAHTPLIEIPKGTKKAERDKINAINDAFVSGLRSSKAGITKLKSLSRIMQGLSEFDPLYQDIVNLRKEVVGGNIDPEVALGRGNVKQRFANKNLGWMYLGHTLFPQFFPEEVLEIAEKHRDRNRKTTSQARGELRYEQDKAYWEKALDKAGDYAIFNDSRIKELNKAYPFLGIGTDAKSAPKRVNKKALGLIDEWVTAGTLAEQYRKVLQGGGLSQTDQKTYIDLYKTTMDKFIKLLTKIAPDQHEIAVSLKKMRNETIGSGGGGSNYSKLAWSYVGRALVSDVLAPAASMLESYWAESIPATSYASKTAYYNRIKMGGQAGGSIVGSIIGGIIGGLVGGPVGAAAGVSIGGSAGGIVGGMPGSYMGTKYEADKTRAGEMAKRVRNKALFGSSYSTYFENALTTQGIANGESAMGGLADKSMGFRARMMLGQVGEQEMLYMSMMPNYYAALMAGVTGPELLRIYKHDLDGIGDPSMRYLVGQSIGNTDALAAANSPYFADFYSKVKNRAVAGDKMVGGLERGFMFTKADVAATDIGKNVYEMFATASRGDETIFNKKYNGTETSPAENLEKIANGIATITTLLATGGVQLNVGVSVDPSSGSDQSYSATLQSYSVGGY